MPLQLKLSAITLDCPDPMALAAFYQQATGLPLHPESNADFAGLDCEDDVVIGFQRVDGYRAPQWPEQTVPQQLHMCFKVKQPLDQVEARLLELGAGRPEHQPHGDKARVLTDPVGHPFCIVKERG
ncbi:VOC family protein [Streptomyces griseorubiginosus]|uniref:VOC family protein n=1 Tax=Streptomyces griseorubiginosus TaxID=67304 RepID=UPI0036397767